MNNEYLNNSDNWGSNARISLTEFVNDFYSDIQPDDYIANVSRTSIINKAYIVLKELYLDVIKEVKAIRSSIGPLLNIPLPEDYIGLVRLSYVDDEGNVYEMTRNSKSATARDYLQDSDYEYLFDDEGYLLESNGFADEIITSKSKDNYSSCVTISKDQKLFYEGTYLINEEEGTIQFSSDIAGMDIVLEYMTTGITAKKPTLIRVHHFATEALRSGIMYELIRSRRNVPEYVIVRERKNYYNARRKTKARFNAMNYAELYKTLTKHT